MFVEDILRATRSNNLWRLPESCVAMTSNNTTEKWAFFMTRQNSQGTQVVVWENCEDLTNKRPTIIHETPQGVIRSINFTLILELRG